MKVMLRSHFLALFVPAVVLLLLLAAAVITGHELWQRSHPFFNANFHASEPQRFSAGGLLRSGWQQFGGSWQLRDGQLLDLSDDRGAKLVTGNSHWQDYQIEGDVMLMGETGDAGFLLRTSAEEVGVDSYHGYFAGVRDLDDTLIMGRADFGWHEFRSEPMKHGVLPGHWYHLRFIAYECTFVVTAMDDTGQRQFAATHDADCIREGRFGVQAYSTGAAWRNVRLRPSSQLDIDGVLEGKDPGGTWYPPGIPGIADLDAFQRSVAPIHRVISQDAPRNDQMPIADLRLLPPDRASQVTVQGVVTLLSPFLYVEDRTGGVAVVLPKMPVPVQIGDAVVVHGMAEQRDFSSVIKGATVQKLWSHSELPISAATAAQAATGAYDAQFIETEGVLSATERRDDRHIVLHLRDGMQSFTALAEYSSGLAAPRDLRVGSRLRLRGVCVTDKSSTGGEVPFLLLLRSTGDVDLIEGPPWWNFAHLAEIFIALLFVGLGLQYLYTSVKRSQLRAAIDERESLALEMHDTLAQSFAGLGYQLEALRDEAGEATEMGSQLQHTLDLVRFAHAEARQNIASLRPGKLEEQGLPEALHDAAKKIIGRNAIAIELKLRGVEVALPLRIADPMLRIAQEAIANAVRHGRPRKIEMLLVYGRGQLKMTVRDDGCGFVDQAEPSGFGVRGMRRRAVAIGARFRIQSVVGKGTIVAVRVKVPRALPLLAWSRRWVGLERILP